MTEAAHSDTGIDLHPGAAMQMDRFTTRGNPLSHSRILRNFSSLLWFACALAAARPVGFSTEDQYEDNPIHTSKYIACMRCVLRRQRRSVVFDAAESERGIMPGAYCGSSRGNGSATLQQ